MDAKDAPEMGAITKTAQSVGQGLAKLSEALNASQGVTDKDRAQMAQIMDLYVDLIENKLTQDAGQNPPEEQAMPVEQPISAEAGLNGVPMNPTKRM